jgi:hypothetical protein
MDFEIKMRPQPGDSELSKAVVRTYSAQGGQLSGQIVLEGETAETRLMLQTGGRIEITELNRPLVYDPEQFAAVPVDFTPEDTLTDPNRPKPDNELPEAQKLKLQAEDPVRGSKGVPGAKAGEPGYGATGRAPVPPNPTARQAAEQESQSYDNKPKTPSNVDRTPAGHDMPISYDPQKAQAEKERKEQEERKREDEARARNDAKNPPQTKLAGDDKENESKGGKFQPHNTVDTKPAPGGTPHGGLDHKSKK